MGESSVSTRHLTVPIARMVASRAAVDITNNQEVDISKVVVEVASAAAVAAVVDTTAEDMVTTTMETAVVQAMAALAVVVVMAAAMVCTSARCRQFWYLQRPLESIYTQLERTNSFRRWRW